jgi:hypothetical protein
VNQGFIQFPREFESDPFWRSLTSQWQRVFIFILFRLSYKEQGFYVGDKLFKILPGQYATSERRFVDDFNSTCPKSDHISRGSWQRFQRDLKTCHILDHIILGTSIHKITVLTIIHPVLCKQFEKKSGPQEKTKSGPHFEPQSSHIQTTHKESKESEDSSLSFKKENEKEKSESQKIISPSFSDLHQEEIFEGISVYAKSIGFPIDDSVLVRWVKDFGEELLTNSLTELVNKNTKKTFQGNHEAYLESVLGAKMNFKKNLEFIMAFKDKNNIEYLTITKQYCYFEPGQEYLFKLNHERFKECIEEKYQRIKNYK